MSNKRVKLFGIIFAGLIVLSIIAFSFVKVVKTGVEYLFHTEKINSYYEEGKYDDVVKYIDSLLKNNSEKSYLYTEKGYSLIELGEYEKAVDSLNKALKFKPKNVEALSNMSWAYYCLGKYSEALDYSNKALKISPKDEEALIDKGNALIEFGKYDEAIGAYTSAIKHNPEAALAYYGRGISYLDSKRYNESTQDFIKYISMVPEDADGYYYLGKSHLYNGHNAEAIGTFIQLLKREPKYTDAYILKGEALDNEGRYDEALKSYDMAIKLEPNYTDAYVEKGISYYTQGKYNESIALMDKAIMLEPDYTAPYVWKGKNYIELSQIPNAVAACDKATAIDRGDAFALNTKSQAYYIQGNYKSALDAASLAIENSTDYEDAYVSKASILVRERNYIEANSFIDNALKIFPQNSDLLWYKGNVLSNTLEHEEAVKYFEKVIELEKGNNDVVLDAAWEYYYLQRYDKASEYINKISKDNGKNPGAEMLSQALADAKLPEAQRIVKFVRENYLYLNSIKDFDKKAKEFEEIKNPSIVDINIFLKSIIYEKDRFSYLIYGKEYEGLEQEETSISLTEKLLAPDIEYISFPVFTQNMGSQFIKAVNKIDKPEGKILVIDLRNNPGGAMSAANDMLDILLGKVKASSLTDRNGKEEAFESDTNQVRFKRIIVMVNERSASSSELLALSLKKHLDNVIIIGHPTFGKGVGQNGFEDRNKKYALYLTSFYWKVENQNISGSRIVPDIIIKSSNDNGYFDMVYKLTSK